MAPKGKRDLVVRGNEKMNAAKAKKGELMTPPLALSMLDDQLRQMRLDGADLATGARWEAYAALLEESRRLHLAMHNGDMVVPASVEQLYLNAIGENKATTMKHLLEKRYLGQSQPSVGITTITATTNVGSPFTTTAAVAEAPKTSALVWLDMEIGRVRAKGTTVLKAL